jgi:hypothetical protein
MVYHILYIFRRLAVAQSCIFDSGKQPPSEHRNAHNNLQRMLSYRIWGRQLLRIARNCCISSNLSGLDYDTLNTSMVPLDLPCRTTGKYLIPEELVCRNSGMGVCTLA